MGTVHFSINPNPENLTSGHLVYFTLFSAIGIFIGFALYLLVRRLQKREAAFLDRRPGPPSPALFMGSYCGS
jgi:hypothetical protein